MKVCLFFGLETETEDVIHLVKNGRTMQLQVDRMTMKLLKYVIDFIKNPLVYMYNQSIQQGIFPDLLKLAVIKPIFKGGDKKQVINYRPISLLSNFAKIFEKIVKKKTHIVSGKPQTSTQKSIWF